MKSQMNRHERRLIVCLQFCLLKKKKNLKEKVSAAFTQRSTKNTDFAVAPLNQGQRITFYLFSLPEMYEFHFLKGNAVLALPSKHVQTHTGQNKWQSTNATNNAASKATSTGHVLISKKRKCSSRRPSGIPRLGRRAGFRNFEKTERQIRLLDFLLLT